METPIPDSVPVTSDDLLSTQDFLLEEIRLLRASLQHQIHVSKDECVASVRHLVVSCREECLDHALATKQECARQVLECKQECTAKAQKVDDVRVPMMPLQTQDSFDISALASEVGALRQGVIHLQNAVAPLMVKASRGAMLESSPASEKAPTSGLIAADADKIFVSARDVVELKQQQKQQAEEAQTLKQQLQVIAMQTEANKVGLGRYEQDIMLKDSDVKQLHNQPTLEGGQAQPGNQTDLGQGVNPYSEEKEEKDMGEFFTEEMVDSLVASSGRDFQESIWDASVLLGFKCIGLQHKILMCIALFITIAVELMFSAVVYANYNEQPISDEALQGLLHWRAVVAHDIAFADPVTFTTLATRVCNQASSTYRAGNQFSQLGDFQKFRKPDMEELETLNGYVLCNMALCLWVFNILYDIADNFRFMFSVLQYPRGVPCIRRVSEESGAIESFSWGQLVFMLLFVALPRLSIAIFLGYSGVLFLAYTSNLGDMLLNAMALGFVLDIDENIFVWFLPHGTKCALCSLEPLLPLQLGTTKSQGHHRAMLVQTAGLLLRTMTTVILILLCNIIILIPFRENMDLALYYLCRGNLDIVYTIHSATSLVYTAPAVPFNESTSYEMSYAKMAVLDAINLGVESYQRYLGNPDNPMNSLDYTDSTVPIDLPTLWKLSQLNEETATQAMHCIDYLDEALMSDYYNQDFASAFHRAARLGAGGRFGMQLEDCSQFDFWAHCLRPQSPVPRALCPRHCGCDNPWLGNALANSKNGCPQMCNIRWELNAYYLVPRSIAEYTDRCMDVPVEILVNEPSWIAYVHSVTYLFPHSVASGALLKKGCDRIHRLDILLGVCKTGQRFMSPRLWCPATCKCRKSDMLQCPRSCSENVFFQQVSHRQHCPLGLEIESVSQCELAASLLFGVRMEVVLFGNYTDPSSSCYLSNGRLIWSNGVGANASTTICRQPEPLLFDDEAKGDFEQGKLYAKYWLGDAAHDPVL